MIRNIGIIGCGWLGLPLAKTLIASGFKVRGSTTTAGKLSILQDTGIRAYQIVLGEEEIKGNMAGFLRGLDAVIVNVPPGLRSNPGERYVKKMELLHREIQKAEVTDVLFISSISVYGAQSGEITEDTFPHPKTESGKQLLASENIFRNDRSLRTSVIRFGGLIGPERHPVTHLAGKKGLSNGEDFVNLIHLNDCIGMITVTLTNEYWGEIFNGVYPDHPKKEDYYTKEAQKRGLPVPRYDRKTTKYKGKRIKSRNFLIKNYCFSTPLTY
ncbi:MAG TPA: SDR family oxidoreductase [Eudoraea sp.]|nr:SDR family oxidoreductase [Eudoraea sp.]